jgi:hypothetical protein
MSQPSLGNQISKLEQTLGTDLSRATVATVELTTAGRRVYARSHPGRTARACRDLSCESRIQGGIPAEV